ncbi:hypothetical protein AX14_005738 [Amanita brunnescens Koide BX004]|nr:hypothetical protein AX14_005738 [Amanita brunnescens Koide BX004]
MEKFSAYRDSGTGIQPFLPLVPPSTDALAGILLPLRYVLATVRTALILVLLVIYVALVPGFCACLIPIPPLHRFVSHLLTATLGRAALFFLGLLWIPVEYAQRKSRRGDVAKSTWNPKAGDVIITNWVSWIELIWLAVRYNPIFVLPVLDKEEGTSDASDTKQASTGRRRPVTQHATPNGPRSRIPITKFQELSLLSIISMTGHVPLFLAERTTSSLKDIIKRANRPVVVLPECTTSNGRGLLRFSSVFQQRIPVKEYQVFVMCVRYDLPSTFVPSAAHCIPNSFLNPLPHLFRLATALKPINLQVRLLAPAESPSSPLFVASEVIFGVVEDELAEASVALVSQVGKLKRTNLGWEDKRAFLEFYYNKSK